MVITSYLKMDSNIEMPKAKDFRWYITKTGDRTLTPTQKRKIKEEQNFRCAICGKKFKPRYLHVHHKKEIHKYKSPLGLDLPEYSMGKKIKPKYDKRSNLVAVCIECHDKTKKKKSSKKILKKKPKTKTKKTTRKKRTTNSFDFGI